MTALTRAPLLRRIIKIIKVSNQSCSTIVKQVLRRFHHFLPLPWVMSTVRHGQRFTQSEGRGKSKVQDYSQRCHWHWNKKWVCEKISLQFMVKCLFYRCSYCQWSRPLAPLGLALLLPLLLAQAQVVDSPLCYTLKNPHHSKHPSASQELQLKLSYKATMQNIHCWIFSPI